MAVYLKDHPPARTQFYTSRSKPVTAIGLHTAENTTDLVLPDSGAEGVARFISQRSTAGSYASIVDSDSVVRVGEYSWTMFHIAGFNSQSLGLSWACRAAQWPTLPPDWVTAAIVNGAREAARMSAWVLETYGYPIPARLLTGQQAKAGVHGFVTHQAVEDLTKPGRRTDPGRHFPFNSFFVNYIEAHLQLTGVHPDSGQTKGPAVPDRSDLISAHQRELVSKLGYNLGSTGPDGKGVDGDYGPKTRAADAHLVSRVVEAEAALVDTRSKLGAAQKRIAELEARKPHEPTPLQVAGADLVVALRRALLSDFDA